jgi:hypothetical protein
MKNSRYLHTNGLVAGLLLLLFVTTTSCGDSLMEEYDAFGGAQTDIICFGAPKVRSDATTRSDASGGALRMVNADSSDSLFLLTSIGDMDNLRTNMTRAEMLKSDGIEGFNVVSKIKKSASDATYLYINQPYTLSGDNYVGETNYYWPGSGWTLDFYAAVNAEIDTDDISLSYNVPASIGDQKDILVAASQGVAGDNNKVVPLSFSHLCTSVQFVVGSIPSDRYLKAVRLKGVANSGTYSLTGSSWTLDGSTGDFELTGNAGLDIAEDGSVTSEENCFMMLPQSFSSDSEAKVEVVLAYTATKKEQTYTASLAGAEWQAGQAVKYSISVSTDYQLELKDLPNQVDAHYIISKVTLNASYVANDTWTLSADNGATLIYADEANEYISDGFWTDRIVDDGVDIGSARGDSIGGGTLTSERNVYVMIPENTGTESRNITLKFSINGKQYKTYTITQLAAVNGWEQIQDGNGADFGFYWDRVVYYVYLYQSGSSDYTANSKSHKSYCESVIKENGAGDYAEVDYTDSKTGLTALSMRRWYYIKIDYGKLGSLAANSDSEGYSNTLALYKKAGAAVANSFEKTLSTIKKTQSGHEDENAFAIGEGIDVNQAPAPTGEFGINSSAAVGECLKKNRYNLKKVSSSSSKDDGDNTNEDATALTPVIEESDIVWYLPAVNEFSSAPSGVNGASCWSSTVDASGSTNAYNGAGESVSRKSSLSVRARRQQ